MARGAHSRGGRAPDPNALRRDRKDDAAWITLPIEGREGPVPEWPLGDQSEREAALWEREWRRPQAIMWERNGQEHELAMYVRSFAAAELPNATAAARALVLRQQEGLGISIPGLNRNKWRIEGGAVPAVETPSGAKAKRSRRGLKVVPGGRAAS